MGKQLLENLSDECDYIHTNAKSLLGVLLKGIDPAETFRQLMEGLRVDVEEKWEHSDRRKRSGLNAVNTIGNYVKYFEQNGSSKTINEIRESLKKGGYEILEQAEDKFSPFGHKAYVAQRRSHAGRFMKS